MLGSGKVVGQEVVMRFLLEKFRTYFEIREMQILSGQKTPGPWGRLSEAFRIIAPYLVIAASILILSVAAKLFFNSSIPLTIGGVILSLEGLLLGFYVCPDRNVLRITDYFSSIIKKMGVGRYADRAEIQDRFLNREKKRGVILRWASNGTSILLFLFGIVIAFLSEAL